MTHHVLTGEFRSIFELTESENEGFVEMTKSHLLEGTSKWSAKVKIKGAFCCENESVLY